MGPPCNMMDEWCGMATWCLCFEWTDDISHNFLYSYYANKRDNINCQQIIEHCFQRVCVCQWGEGKWA